VNTEGLKWESYGPDKSTRETVVATAAGCLSGSGPGTASSLSKCLLSLNHQPHQIHQVKQRPFALSLWPITRCLLTGPWCLSLFDVFITRSHKSHRRNKPVTRNQKPKQVQQMMDACNLSPLASQFQQVISFLSRWFTMPPSGWPACPLRVRNLLLAWR